MNSDGMSSRNHWARGPGGSRQSGHSEETISGPASSSIQDAQHTGLYFTDSTAIMQWASHTACTGDMKSALKLCSEIPQVRSHLGH